MNRGLTLHRFLARILLTFSLFLMTSVMAYAAGVNIIPLLDTARLGAPFVFDVNPQGAVLVLTSDNVLDVGSGKFLFGEPLKNPAWLDFADGKLQMIADGALFVVDGQKPRQLLEVPLKSRIFAADGERTFISGVTSSGKPILYLFKEGVGHKALLELDAPIDAMALARGVLFFSVGPRIYTLRDGGPARLFAHLPGFSHIPSLAVDDRHGLLYFSDGDHLYAVRGNDFVLVRRGLGGMLRWRDESLYVLSWRDHLLLRLSGLAEVLGASGTLVPLDDPCSAPVLALHCGAEEKRATLKTLALFGKTLAPDDTAARKEFDLYWAEQEKEFTRVRAELRKEAVVGTQAMLWGGGREPKAIRANESIATTGKGVGLTLWDGSGIRIGPDSKLVIDDCSAVRECRMTLAKGLLYFEPYQPPADGVAAPTAREYATTTLAMNLSFSEARFVLFAAGGKTYVVVLEGRLTGSTPEGDTVIMAAGETLEVQRGEKPGSPLPAEMGRLNKWWEEIR